MLFRYKGTKNLKVPILGPQLAIPAYQADPKVCVARCIKAYLDRSADFDHQDRVWCCTVKKDGAYPAVSIRGDTLRGWMRRVMTRCGVDPVFTGGSIRQAASSKAINDGWEPAAVLELGMWKSFAMWNRFYNRSRLSMSTGLHFSLFRLVNISRTLHIQSPAGPQAQPPGCGPTTESPGFAVVGTHP